MSYFVVAPLLIWLSLVAMSVFEALQKVGGSPHTILQEFGLATLHDLWPNCSRGQRSFYFAFALVCGVVGLASAWFGGALYLLSIGRSPFDDYTTPRPWFELFCVQLVALAIADVRLSFGQRRE